MGVFAARAPRRINPVGLSLVQLLDVSGRYIRFTGVDLLDETPVIDIKPYVTRFDKTNRRPTMRLVRHSPPARRGYPSRSRSPNRLTTPVIKSLYRRSLGDIVTATTRWPPGALAEPAGLGPAGKLLSVGQLQLSQDCGGVSLHVRAEMPCRVPISLHPHGLAPWRADRLLMAGTRHCANHVVAANR
jgi:tRNA-methyltransferase O